MGDGEKTLTPESLLEKQLLAGGKSPVSEPEKQGKKSQKIDPEAVAKVPRGLTGPARKFWLKVVPQLIEAELVGEVDRPVLRTLCEQYGRYCEANQTLKKEGLTFTTPKGYIQQRPEVSIAQTALKNFMSLAPHFGLTPKARKALELDLDDKNDADPMDKFLARKK